MSLNSITAEEAFALQKQGALLVDIRQADEFAREHITHAQMLPINTSQCAGKTVIFYCQSGRRTQNQIHTLANMTQNEAFILAGGIEAWKKAGLSTEHDASQPISMQRQVQIVAGLLILTGFSLGYFVHPHFLWLCAFVGAGLTFAGITGFCGMAILLGKLPWNKGRNTCNTGCRL